MANKSTYILRQGGLGYELGGRNGSTAHVLGAGTSSSKVVCDTANTKFMEFRFDCGATSGDNRGMYLRLYTTGAGGGGEALRAFHTVEDVAAATVHGAHLSLSFGSTGSCTGQGIATRSTLHLPNEALTASNVTYSALQAEIYCDGASSDPAGNYISYLRFVNGGNATGGADVDDDAALFEFDGFSSASGNMIGANGSSACQINFTNWVPIRIRIAHVDHYLIAAQTVAAVSS